MNNLQFGKRTITESYFNGELVNRHVTESIPVRVQNKSQALDEMIKGLDVIANRSTSEVILKVESDKKSGSIRLITKTYTVDE